MPSTTAAAVASSGDWRQQQRQHTMGKDKAAKADKAAKVDTPDKSARPEIPYEQRAAHVSVIAKPLADDKLTKRVLKLSKRAAKRKQIKRGVKEVVKAIRKSTKGCAGDSDACAEVGGLSSACAAVVNLASLLCQEGAPVVPLLTDRLCAHPPRAVNCTQYLRAGG